MCEYYGYDVVKLERVRIMNISLKGLPLGDWRDLEPEEMAIIYKMIKGSSSSKSENPEKRNKKKTNSENKLVETLTRNNPDNRNRRPAGNKRVKERGVKRK
jgi:23S rRNA pseudouridine2604 synthase